MSRGVQLNARGNLTQIKNKFCLSEAPLIQAIIALRRHSIPFWNQNDPRFETLPFSFGSKGPISPLSLCHC